MNGPRITPGGLREVGPFVRGFAAVAGRAMGTEDPQVFLLLGRTRRLFWGWLLFAGGLMPGGTLPRRETELVILRVAALTGCVYCLNCAEAARRICGFAGIRSARPRRVLADNSPQSPPLRIRAML